MRSKLPGRNYAAKAQRTPLKFGGVGRNLMFYRQ